MKLSRSARTLLKWLMNLGGAAAIVVTAAGLLICPATVYQSMSLSLAGCHAITQVAINEIMTALVFGPIKYGAWIINGITITRTLFYFGKFSRASSVRAEAKERGVVS